MDDIYIMVEWPQQEPWYLVQYVYDPLLIELIEERLKEE